MSLLRIRLVLLLLLVMAPFASAWADVFKLAEFEFQALQGHNDYQLTARIPTMLASRQPIKLPDGCRDVSLSVQPIGKEVQHSYRISCNRPLRASDQIDVPWPLDGAILNSIGQDGPARHSLQPTEGRISLPVGAGIAPARPFLAVAADYLSKGIVHILIGWDHLAFILCLYMLARGRQLLLLVTAFTIGHSITLALAFLDLIRIPVPPVEASIAFSIVFMAREALRGQEKISGPPSWRWAMLVVAFGLLHGLGFASVLDELGVASGEKITGLLFFNLGVEVGQLLFIGGLAITVHAAQLLSSAQAFRAVSLLIAGTVGAFWTVERVAGFF